MKIVTLIWRCIMRSFAYTSLFALALYLMMALTDPTMNAMVPAQYLLLLLFGTICGFAQELFILRRLPLVARIGIHYGTLLVSFFLIYIFSNKISPEFGKLMIFALIFSLIYAAIVGIAFAILHFTGIYRDKYAYQSNGEKIEEPYINKFR